MTDLEVVESNTTHEIKLYFFNEYDLYHNIVKRLRGEKDFDQRIEVIKRYAKMAFDYISSKSSDPLRYNSNEIDYKYLLSCFDEDLKEN